MEFIIQTICDRVLYKCFSTERLLANVAAGIFIALIALWFLKKHVEVDKGYITLTKKQTYLFILLIILAVIFVSPLPFRGWRNLLKTVSIFVTLIVLAVTSYMDKQTSTFVNGYMVIGLLINFVLCILGIVLKSAEINKTSFIMFLCCIMVNVILGLIAYTSADAGLVQMAMFTFVLVDMGNVAFAFIICEFISQLHYLVCSIPKVVGKIKSKEKLRFPFTASIMTGVVITLFFIS